MLATRCASAITIECAVGIQIVSFEITINSFAAGTGGAAPRCGLDHDQRGFFLLGHFRRREPGLLQRGILAEQRFLQRSSHTLSLQTLKFLAPPIRPSIAAVLSQARAHHIPLVRPPQLAVLQRYSITRGQGYAPDS